MSGSQREILRRIRLPAALALAAAAGHGSLVLAVPTGRFLKYPLAAQRWLAGDLPVERWVDFSPLLFHTAVLAERLGDAAALLAWTQIALVGFACGLVFLFLEPHFGRCWAAAGAVVLALDRHLVIYGRLVEPEVWLLVPVLAALVLVNRRRPLAAGVALALAVTVRPTVLPLVLLAPLGWALTSVASDRAPRWRRALAWAPWIGVPCVVALALLAWRAEFATGRWTTPTMNPGTVFFEGHNPSSRGVSAEYPQVVSALVEAQAAVRVPDAAHAAYRRVARSERPNLTVAGVNDYWLTKALAFLKAEPGVALRRSGVKLLYAFHSFAWHDLPAASQYERRLRWLPSLPFGLLSALALVGMAASIRRWREALLLYGLVGSQLGVMVLFYASARQRLLLLPALIYFAVVGSRGLLDRSVQTRRRLLSALLVTTLALALSLPTDAMRSERYEQDAWVRIQAAQSQYAAALSIGDAAAIGRAGLHLAATAGRRIDSMRPADVRSEDAAEFLTHLLGTTAMTDVQASKVGLDAAWLWLDAERPDEALAALATRATRATQSPPPADDRPTAAWFTARALALLGDREAALDVLEQALDQFPGRPELLAEHVVLAPAGAAEDRELLERYGSRADAWWFLGHAHLVHGQPSQAVAFLKPLSADFPELGIETGDLGAGDRDR